MRDPDKVTCEHGVPYLEETCWECEADLVDCTELSGDFVENISLNDYIEDYEYL